MQAFRTDRIPIRPGLKGLDRVRMLEHIAKTHDAY